MCEHGCRLEMHDPEADPVAPFLAQLGSADADRVCSVMLSHINTGHLRAAYGVTGASPMAPSDSPHTGQAMAELHPNRALPTDDEMAGDGTDPICLDKEIFFSKCLSSPSGRGLDIDGGSYEEYRSLYCHGAGETLYQIHVNLAAGKAPQAVVEYLNVSLYSRDHLLRKISSLTISFYAFLTYDKISHL